MARWRRRAARRRSCSKLKRPSFPTSATANARSSGASRAACRRCRMASASSARGARSRRVARLGLLRRADRDQATSSAVRPPAAAASAIRWSATRLLVLEDVADDYVSIERAAKDYGVVLTVIDAEICDYAVDEAATKATREAIRRQRRRLARDRSRGGRGRLSRRRDRQARRGAALRRGARLGHRRAAARLDGPVSGDVSQAHGGRMGEKRRRRDTRFL